MKQVMGQFDPTLYAAMVTSFFLMILGPVLFWIVLPLIDWYRQRRKAILPIPLPMPQAVYHCMNCGRPLMYVPQYGRWYCNKCRI